MLVVGIFTLLMTFVFNFNHAQNNYGLKENSFKLLAESGSTGTEVRDQDCRPGMDCIGTWTGSTDIYGCVNIFGKNYCNFKVSAVVKLNYAGKKENCTRGTTWYDCDACQKDCVPNGTFF